MTEKIKFKAANPPRIMKYDHFAHSALWIIELLTSQLKNPEGQFFGLGLCGVCGVIKIMVIRAMEVFNT